MNTLPILYVKPNCALSREALLYFDQHGIAVQVYDVSENPRYMKRLVEVSGQRQTPTFEFGEFIVPDFTVGELIEELEAVPEVKKALGLGDDED